MGLKAEIEAMYRTSKTAGRGSLEFSESEGGFIEIFLKMGRRGRKPICKVKREDLARVGLFYGRSDRK